MDPSAKDRKMDTESFVDPVVGKTWRKVLFQRGEFPDNFTPDECFLAAIKRNQNLHKYTLDQCFQGSSQVFGLIGVGVY